MLKLRSVFKKERGLQYLLCHHFTFSTIYYQEHKETLKTLAGDVKFFGDI